MLKILKKSKLKISRGIFFLVSLVPRSEILRESLRKILVKICLSVTTPPHASKCIYSPLEGVRGVELVTYSDVINIGLPIGEGRVRLLGFTAHHARHRLRKELSRHRQCLRLRQERGMPRCSVRSLRKRGCKPHRPDTQRGCCWHQ